MQPTSALYRLIDAKLDGKFDEFVASRRGTHTWPELADAIREATGEDVNRETLRLWFAGRLEVTVAVEVKVA